MLTFQIVTCPTCLRPFHDAPMGGQPAPKACPCGESLEGVVREVYHFNTITDAQIYFEEEGIS